MSPRSRVETEDIREAHKTQRLPIVTANKVTPK
jgi:hypothetical protein